ncbi:hypothetical protein [Candidatus Laterigemmans baculatus]|uniref:hypothetical protein n=1 Tax=Candidatus Laterigemmans baculatus TaxID=2770505 RepID=UPI0013DCA2CB|nr:hypothetical protein [Candidatus Laterigemmans baculatus]
MFKTLVGAAALCFAWPAVADAQILRIGPLGGVSVRVPFVSVDVSPYGGTRVRAPLTAIDTSDRYYLAPHGYGYAPIPPGHAVPYRDFHAPYFRGYHRDYSKDPRPPRFDQPHGEILAAPLDGGSLRGGPIPESVYRPALPEIERPPAPQFDIPSFSEVFPGQEPLEEPLQWSDVPTSGTDPTRIAERLRDGALRLRLALERRHQGEIWAEYLRCVELEQLADDLIASRSLAPLSLSEAHELLGNFDGVVANSSLTWVTRLTGFEDTRGALTNLVMVLEAEAGEEPQLDSPFTTSEFSSPRSTAPSKSAPRLTAPRRPNADTRDAFPEAEELPAPLPDRLPKAGDPDAEAPPEPRRVFRAEL